jgi:hypothetical protein
MYRFVVCLLFAATSGVEATAPPTTAPSVASLVYMHYYQTATCTGDALQTIIAPLNTCSCSSQTAGTTCNGYMRITLDGSIQYPHLTNRLYSDNSCQLLTASVSLGAGECNASRMRVVTNEVDVWSSERVLECNQDGCNDRYSGTNSASTISTIASLGLLALIANIICHL